MKLGLNARLGDQVRRLRVRRGLTQRDLGELCGRSEKWLWTIEAGTAKPDLCDIEHLAAALRVDVATVLGLAEEAEDVKRRDFLHRTGEVALVAAVAPGELLQVLAGPPRQVEQLGQITAQLGSWFFRQPSVYLYPLLATHKSTLLSALSTAPAGEARQLKVVSAETCILLALTAYCLDDFGTARQELFRAELLARDAQDGPMLARALEPQRVLVSAADTRGPGSPKAIDLLDAAHQAAGTSAPAVARVMLLCARAEEFAALGRAREAERDLEEAATALASSARLQMGYHDHWDRVRLDGWRASVLLHLNRPGDAAAAAKLLERVAPATPVDLVGYRTATEANLGAAYALAGEPERCVELQLEALAVAGVGDRHDGVARVRRIRDRYLTPYSDTPAVRRLDQQLAGV